MNDPATLRAVADELSARVDKLRHNHKACTCPHCTAVGIVAATYNGLADDLRTRAIKADLAAAERAHA